MCDENEYTVDAMIGTEKHQYAVSMYFEKPIPPKHDGKLTIHRFLITHTCYAINEKEALGDALWKHNYTPDNGQLRLWQVSRFGAEPIEDQVMEVFREKGKIPAIKRRRELTGESLKEAKAVLDELQAKYNLDHIGNPR